MMVDDKLRILTAMKKAVVLARYPAADVVLDGIGELENLRI